MSDSHRLGFIGVAAPEDGGTPAEERGLKVA